MSPDSQTAPRTVTRARVVALLLIAAVLFGLEYLRFGSGEEVMTVPSGAKAGDLIIEPCTFMTEDGPSAADCGTLVVP